MKLLSRLLGGHGSRGGILTGDEIHNQVVRGHIGITDFSTANLNPNSYNLRCGNAVTVYKNISIIDLKDPSTYHDTETYEIPRDDGFILRPGPIYLIPTYETISTNFFEPIITGRSSMGRLGIAIHQEAGFGDIGYHGTLTMQIKVTYPTKIYPMLSMAQVYFLTPHGRIASLYQGRYQNSTAAVASRYGA